MEHSKITAIREKMQETYLDMLNMIASEQGYSTFDDIPSEKQEAHREDLMSRIDEWDVAEVGDNDGSATSTTDLERFMSYYIGLCADLSSYEDYQPSDD